MHEPTQTRMVAAVRCRVRGVLAEVTQVLGLQCAITTGQEAYQNHRLRNRPGPVLGATPPIGLLNGLRPRENNADQI